MVPLFITAAIIVLASLTGLVFTVGPLRRLIHNRISLLTSFAAGVFLITAFFLIQEVFELASPEIGVGAIVGGFVLFMIIQYMIPESHHHHDDDCDHSHNRKSAIKILIGDGIHNIGDGILLVPAFFVSVELGIITGASILVHEFVQSISEFFVLRQGGYSTRQALARNFLVNLTLFIGIGLGLLLTQSDLLQAILLGISAGAFLQIVFHDLVPHQHQVHAHGKGKHIAVFILGLLIIVLINQVMPHGDEEEVLHEDYRYEEVEIQSLIS